MKELEYNFSLKNDPPSTHCEKLTFLMFAQFYDSINLPFFATRCNLAQVIGSIL